MSRWFALLEELEEESLPVQNVQNVQISLTTAGFEQIEQIEQRTKPITASKINQESFEERAAMIEANGVPRDWAEGFATLCSMPCPDAYQQQRWEQIINDGGCFLDAWGKQAAALGWQALDVFGANPNCPEWRYDGMGLVVLLEGRRVVAITADAARIECGNGVYQTFNRRNMGCEIDLLWKSTPQIENSDEFLF